MKNLGLETFGSFPSLSKKAESKLEWLEIELKARHPLGKELSASRIKHWKGLQRVEVRAMVHRLRVDGFPIGSNSKGYFWAYSPEDLETTIKHLEQRENSIFEVRNILLKTFRSMKKEVQVNLFGGIK